MRLLAASILPSTSCSAVATGFGSVAMDATQRTTPRDRSIVRGRGRRREFVRLGRPDTRSTSRDSVDGPEAGAGAGVKVDGAGYGNKQPKTRFDMAPAECRRSVPHVEQESQQPGLRETIPGISAFGFGCANILSSPACF
eukprot:202408-Chlamydomonas_euryale.AAC.3